jgi:hypothetical protein
MTAIRCATHDTIHNLLICTESAATAGNPARDGECEKIRTGIPAAARRVSVGIETERDSVSRSSVASTDGGG